MKIADDRRESHKYDIFWNFSFNLSLYNDVAVSSNKKIYLTRTEISLSGSNIWSRPFSLIITRKAWKSSVPAFWWVRIDNPLMVTRRTRHVFTSWFEHHDKIHKIYSLNKQISIEIFGTIIIRLKLIILGIQGLYVWWRSRFCRVAN